MEGCSWVYLDMGSFYVSFFFGFISEFSEEMVAEIKKAHNSVSLNILYDIGALVAQVQDSSNQI